MTLEKQFNSDWQSCQPGDLRRFAHEQLATERREFLVKSSSLLGGSLLSMAGLYAIYYQMTSEAEPDFGGIVCSKVRSNLSAYAQHQLDETLSETIRIHLSQCPGCQAAMLQISS